MPRSDRTYTSDDVLRIVAKNLTPQERQEVIDGLGVTETGEGSIAEEEVNFLQDFVNLVQEFIPFVGEILATGALLGDLFNQVDIERARTEAFFIRVRVPVANDVLTSIDF